MLPANEVYENKTFEVNEFYEKFYFENDLLYRIKTSWLSSALIFQVSIYDTAPFGTITKYGA